MKKNNTKKASNLEEKETVKNKPKKPKKTEEINSNNSEPKVQKLPFLSWKLRPFFMIIWIIFLLLFFVYLLLISFVGKIETIITFPRGNYFNQEVSILSFPLGYEDINISDGNGNNINGIYVGGDAEKTVYYFHGNGGPLELFYSDIEYIHNLGYNVMAYDYPSYGKSSGFPDKNVVENFSDKFFKYIQKEKGLKNDDLEIWGFSIGTAVAVDFASKNDFDKIVLVAPFSSRYDIVMDKIGFPLQRILFLNNSFVTRDLVSEFDNKALIIHSNKDEIIPFNEGEVVYYNYAGKKYFIEIDEFGHNGILSYYGKALKNIFKDFLETGNLDFENNYLFLDKNLKKELEFESNVDLYTDSSVQKFVTSTISFDDMQYVPENLVSIASDYISDMKGGYQTLRIDAKNALDDLGKNFYEQFGMKLGIVSAYRSYSYQYQIKQGCGDTWCAKPGYSEHQTGLVVDIFEASSEGNWRTTPSLRKYFDWLNENAHKYGWHNTYQKGVEIDGYEVEPWHRRYLGVELATYLLENNLTFAEYYREKQAEESDKIQ